MIYRMKVRLTYKKEKKERAEKKSRTGDASAMVDFLAEAEHNASLSVVDARAVADSDQPEWVAEDV